jgi:hypothetical protein
MFMRMARKSSDQSLVNCRLLCNSSIVISQDIDCDEPVELVCDWGKWAHLHTADLYPSKLFQINSELDCVTLWPNTLDGDIHVVGKNLGSACIPKSKHGRSISSLLIKMKRKSKQLTDNRKRVRAEGEELENRDSELYYNGEYERWLSEMDSILSCNDYTPIVSFDVSDDFPNLFI